MIQYHGEKFTKWVWGYIMVQNGWPRLLYGDQLMTVFCVVVRSSFSWYIKIKYMDTHAQVKKVYIEIVAYVYNVHLCLIKISNACTQFLDN